MKQGGMYLVIMIWIQIQFLMVFKILFLGNSMLFFPKRTKFI